MELSGISLGSQFRIKERTHVEFLRVVATNRQVIVVRYGIQYLAEADFRPVYLVYAVRVAVSVLVCPEHVGRGTGTVRDLDTRLCNVGKRTVRNRGQCNHGRVGTDLRRTNLHHARRAVTIVVCTINRSVRLYERGQHMLEVERHLGASGLFVLVPGVRAAYPVLRATLDEPP